jgi:hypothetical protein
VTIPEGSGEGVTIVTAGGVTLTENDPTTEVPVESVTLAVNVYEPALAEVPEIDPVAASPIPAGSEPPARVNV